MLEIMDIGAESRRGLVALAHPLAVASLVVLVLNDHVLKATFSSGLTGKLSDIAGAIFVPLLIAVGLERFTDRAIHIGMAATALVLASINLFTFADRTYEAALGLLVPSTNTMDPTDLLVIPFVFLARMIWTRAAAPTTPLRRQWGMAVFLIGITATAATSNSVPTTETYSGTVLLTAEQPEVEIPINFTLDGEPADLSRVTVRINTIVLGDSSGLIAGLDPVDVRTEGLGDGAVTLTLNDPAYAPVEVEWELYAEGIEAEVCVPFCFGGRDEEVIPELAVDAPPNTFGPEPFAMLAIDLRADADPSVDRVIVTMPPGESALTMRSSKLVDDRKLRFKTSDGEEHPIVGESSAAIARPAGCDEGCELEFEISAVQHKWGGEQLDVEFYLPEAIGMVEIERLPVVDQRRDVAFPLPDPGEVRQNVTVPVAIRLPEPFRFGDAIDVEGALDPTRNDFFHSPVGRIRVDELPDRGAGVVRIGNCVRFDATIRIAEESGGQPTNELILLVRHFSHARAGAEPQSDLEVAIGEGATTFC